MTSIKNYWFKHEERNMAFNAFLYHNREFFNGLRSERRNYKGTLPGIYMEKGTWKWGSQSLQNWLVKNEYVSVDRTDNDTCCLTATPKLVSRMLQRQNDWDAIQANY